MFLDREDGRLRVLRAGRKISDCGTVFQLGDRLGVDAVAPQALLTMLFRSTDRSVVGALP